MQDNETKNKVDWLGYHQFLTCNNNKNLFWTYFTCIMIANLDYCSLNALKYIIFMLPTFFNLDRILWRAHLLSNVRKYIVLSLCKFVCIKSNLVSSGACHKKSSTHVKKI